MYETFGVAKITTHTSERAQHLAQIVMESVNRLCYLCERKIKVLSIVCVLIRISLMPFPIPVSFSFAFNVLFGRLIFFPLLFYFDYICRSI